MALSEILLVIAALAYLVCGVGIVKVLNAPEAVAPAWLRTVGFVGFAAHAVGVLMNMFAPGAIRFGFGMAVSALLCISVAIVLVESLVHRQRFDGHRDRGVCLRYGPARGVSG